MSTDMNVKVWDPLIRIFHWALVVGFFIAYFTEEDFLTPHVWVGYMVGGLLLFRVVWGFIGPSHARFSDFVFSPAVVVSYVKDVLLLKAKRFIGHNPAGGAMIILLLISLLITTLSGIVLYAVGDNAGPMAAWMGGLGESWEDIFEELHEFFADFTMFLVFIHVAGVLVESLIHRENLVRAMVNGYKRGAE